MVLRIPPGLGRIILFRNESGELQPPDKEYDYISHDTWTTENTSNPKFEVSKYPDFAKKLALMEPDKSEMGIVLDELVAPTVVRKNALVRLLSNLFYWATRNKQVPQPLQPKTEKATYAGIIQEDTSVPGGSASFMFRTNDGKTHWIHISTMYQNLM